MDLCFLPFLMNAGWLKFRPPKVIFLEKIKKKIPGDFRKSSDTNFRIQNFFVCFKSIPLIVFLILDDNWKFGSRCLESETRFQFFAALSKQWFLTKIFNQFLIINIYANGQVIFTKHESINSPNFYLFLHIAHIPTPSGRSDLAVLHWHTYIYRYK